MKINVIPVGKAALLTAAFCTALFAFSHNASAVRHPLPFVVSLTFGDAKDLGQVFSGIPSGDADRLAYVNHLIDMAPGNSNTFRGQTFHRSLNNPGPGFSNYPDAVLVGLKNGIGTNVNLGNGTLYSYLFAKYDGKNAGAEVWYVGDLSGVIHIPAFGLADQHYGLSGWTLFGPGVPQVPDGGATVTLLGVAIGVLGVARDFLMG